MTVICSSFHHRFLLSPGIIEYVVSDKYAYMTQRIHNHVKKIAEWFMRISNFDVFNDLTHFWYVPVQIIAVKN